jgi:hypothetical protein
MRALRDELHLAGRKVRADVLARHGSARLGPVMIQLGGGGPSGAARSGAARSNSALAVEALGVILGAEQSALVLASAVPDRSTSERLASLAPASAGDDPTDLAGWLRDLVEDPRDRWRSTWLRSCAIHAAQVGGLLDQLDLGPARALRDPMIDELLDRHA